MSETYNKSDDVTFSIVSSFIPDLPAYGAHVSQLLRCSRAYSKYKNFLERELLLTGKLLKQGYQKSKLRSSLQKFYGCHHELVEYYGICAFQLV